MLQVVCIPAKLNSKLEVDAVGINIPKTGSLKASPAPRQAALGRDMVFLPHGSMYGNTMLAALTELTESGEGNDCGCRAKAQLVSIPHPGSSLGQMHGLN